jgi:hypothetical protein
MWATLQTEIAARILAVEVFFSALVGPPTASSSPAPVSPALATAKGLVFVQLYAIHEYTVQGIVQAALSEIKGRSTPIKTVRFDLLGLILHPEVTAVRDCGVSRQWSNRLKLFRKAISSDLVDIADSVFPSDGSQFRLHLVLTMQLHCAAHSNLAR